tara:strand:- start:11 stop:631 length:621 start_codon:yes stop_codon:yes gene_type:complete
MYYPQSQIKTNLYTKGKEYYISNSEQDYKGYYYTLSNGDSFSGKTPQTPGKGEKIILYSKDNQSISNDINDKDNDVYTIISDPSYLRATNIKNFQKLYTLPTSSYPIPTKKDYKLGEFERYFLSKRNEVKFLEVNEFTYNQYLIGETNVAYQLYQPIKLSWGLTGIKETVYEVNYRTVERVQNNSQLRGFIEYFRGKFDRFYKIVG